MSKKKRKVRKSFFPKKPTASNMMYYNSLVKVLLVIIIIVVGFVFFHYISFNHHRVKIKIVTTYKDRYIIPENIVFLGDSITHRYNLDKYYSDNNVVNSGINSDTIDNILSDMYNRVYRYNPSKVVLLIGTNDMLKDDNDKISLGIESIINQIHKKMPFTKIYVESIYPVNNSLDNSMVKNRDNNRILELNGMIMSLCKKFNFTKYVNIYDSLVKNAKLNEEYTEDGLHLNDKGYDIVTEIIDNEVIEDNKNMELNNE